MLFYWIQSYFRRRKNKIRCLDVVIFLGKKNFKTRMEMGVYFFNSLDL